MMKVNVYDFDKTILPYDSTAAFFMWCAGEYKGAARAALPGLFASIPFALGRIDQTRHKELFYRFLRAVPDIDAALEIFWDENFPNINGWYLRQKRPDDIIISASPDFLVRVPAERLGVRLIASRVDKHTGVTTGKNNNRAEKVRRLNEEFPGTEIGEFYSDSRHDDPLAALAERAFIVKGQRVLPWPEM